SGCWRQCEPRQWGRGDLRGLDRWAAFRGCQYPRYGSDSKAHPDLLLWYERRLATWLPVSSATKAVRLSALPGLLPCNLPYSSTGQGRIARSDKQGCPPGIAFHRELNFRHHPW